MSAYVYILRCGDGRLYVGSTRNLAQRIEQHQSGKGSAFTSRRLPVELVFSEECPSIGDAYGLERKLHGWSRAKKEALISGRYDLLPGLSRNRQRVPPEPSAGSRGGFCSLGGADFAP
ncbi:MAG: GIY-YIG nuclease family protein [Gordonia sp. (in: high G+C Gram-positive bacteria)]|uniref:GIY-YIG nuclease family protein n=1 Tax=Gordonia sp. (in: high G+C Gram-positive bacteria) TaxID=84139 RepID=UPI003BB5587C